MEAVREIFSRSDDEPQEIYQEDAGHVISFLKNFENEDTKDLRVAISALDKVSLLRCFVRWRCSIGFVVK